jgi:hypothetical protein
MVTLIAGLPENVAGFQAEGEISAKDYTEVIYPRIDSLLQNHKKIRMLYHIRAGSAKFDMAAILDDAALGIKNYMNWEKVAIVTDAGWITYASKAFGILLPAQVQTFHENQMDDAVRWITG